MRNRRGNRSKRPLLALIFLVVISGAYAGWALQRPLEALQPLQSVRSLIVPAIGSHFTWPAQGQAAVGVLGIENIETNNPQTPVPIASTAKVLTCLVVLDKYPLLKGEQGSSLTITEADVALYRTELGQDGSNLPVAVGDKLTEYQMMQALMLPSANNIANSMAIWAFGSQEAYRAAATAYLKKHGLTSTTVGTDASGLSPTTTSTARDLVKLGKLAMENPVLAEIVNQPSAKNLGQASNVTNVNNLLGTSNIVGIKTGNSEQAGGAFISASRVVINNKPVTIVTAVLAAPNRPTALKNSLSLVQSAQTNFSEVTVAKKGQRVGSYKLPWGKEIPAIAASDLTLTSWNGVETAAPVKLAAVATGEKTAGQAVGSVMADSSAFNNSASASIALAAPVSEPSVWWRLTHPF